MTRKGIVLAGGSGTRLHPITPLPRVSLCDTLPDLFRDPVVSSQGFARILRARLNEAHRPSGMNVPGWRLHPLGGGDMHGRWSAWVNGNWRMAFAFDRVDAMFVDYLDYR